MEGKVWRASLGLQKIPLVPLFRLGLISGQKPISLPSYSGFNMAESRFFKVTKNVYVLQFEPLGGANWFSTSELNKRNIVLI